MYVLLLLLGAVSTAVGALLMAAGIAHEGASAVTPGTIAAVGGLVLIGLAFVVRELQRIERTLSARPMPRASRGGEALGLTEQPDAAARIPFPPRPKPESPAAAPAANSPAAPAEQPTTAETLREKFPALVRLDATSAADEHDVSLMPGPAPRAEEVTGEMDGRAAVGRAAGGASARPVPRLDVRTGNATAHPRSKVSVFDTFWPKGQRPKREGQAAVAQVVPQPAPAPTHAGPAAAAAPVSQAVPRVVASEPAPPVSVLKSGVVEGMAYTLYSDGSIEAQLPQGTLRFGSITELRHHIESGS
jgi:hypothetical protein